MDEGIYVYTDKTKDKHRTISLSPTQKRGEHLILRRSPEESG